MVRKKAGLSERHRKILQFLEKFNAEMGIHHRFDKSEKLST